MKVVKIISSIILTLAFLSLFGALVNSVSKGRSHLGFFTKPFYSFITFPVTVINVLKNTNISSAPPTFKDIDPAFKEKNNLDYDVFATNAFYRNNQWEIRLFNLRDDSILHKWYLRRNDFNAAASQRQFENSDPKNSLLLKNRSIIANISRTKNLFRLDKNSNIIWHNSEKLFHHSINLAEDGNIWTCSSAQAYVKVKNGEVQYLDDFITKVDIQTGKIIFDKSISDLLKENGEINLVHGISNTVWPANAINNDPLHLNDIEPALSNGRYWKKGDLFLSLRHRSVILQYRPQKNKLVRILHGPFFQQHDVDIVSKNEISIFNNNYSPLHQDGMNKKPTDLDYRDELTTSEIIIYNFDDSTFRTALKGQFIADSIYTQSEGLHSLLSSGDTYVESQNDGKLYILNEKEVLLKKYLHTSIEGMIELPHWLRIYENIDF